MTALLQTLPDWVERTLLSLAAVCAAYLGGYVLKMVVSSRLAAFAAATAGHWDDLIVGELSRRIPLWSLLFGVYIAAGFWHLPPNSENALTKALFVVAVFSLTFFSAAVINGLTIAYGSTLQQALPITSLTQNIVKAIVLGIGLLIVLNGLGLSITPILTALGVGGLAVALALQDTLSNLFAGFYVTVAGQIKVGDYVRLESGEEGYIADIGWRATRIRMLANNVVLVPNTKLAQSIVTNYYLPDQEMAVLVEVGVDYASDLEHVERVTCEVAREVLRGVSGGVEQFEPFIRYHTFSDSSINFTVILRVREFVAQYLIKHEFIKRLHERYERENITIPFPIRTIVRRAAPEGTAARPSASERSGSA